jgi:hypothetical protein
LSPRSGSANSGHSTLSDTQVSVGNVPLDKDCGISLRHKPRTDPPGRCGGLKIRVSVVRFRPWPLFFRKLRTDDPLERATGSHTRFEARRRRRGSFSAFASSTARITSIAVPGRGPVLGAGRSGYCVQLHLPLLFFLQSHIVTSSPSITAHVLRLPLPLQLTTTSAIREKLGLSAAAALVFGRQPAPSNFVGTPRHVTRTFE